MANRVEDLRSDYDLLGELLKSAEGSAAASIARERRIIGELLEALEMPEEVTVADELAARRRTPTGDSGAPSRRRKSG
jgi:hypothetical protein